VDRAAGGALKDEADPDGRGAGKVVRGVHHAVEAGVADRVGEAVAVGEIGFRVGSVVHIVERAVGEDVEAAAVDADAVGHDVDLEAGNGVADDDPGAESRGSAVVRKQVAGDVGREGASDRGSGPNGQDRVGDGGEAVVEGDRGDVELARDQGGAGEIVLERDVVRVLVAVILDRDPRVEHVFRIEPADLVLIVEEGRRAVDDQIRGHVSSPKMG
jgi:hypothetical protein